VERQFGRLAAELGWVDPMQVQAAELVVREAERRGTEMTVGQVLQEWRELSLEQIADLTLMVERKIIRCPDCRSPFNATQRAPGHAYACVSCGRSMVVPQALHPELEGMFPAPASEPDDATPTSRIRLRQILEKRLQLASTWAIVATVVALILGAALMTRPEAEEVPEGVASHASPPVMEALPNDPAPVAIPEENPEPSDEADPAAYTAYLLEQYALLREQEPGEFLAALNFLRSIARREVDDYTEAYLIDLEDELRVAGKQAIVAYLERADERADSLMSEGRYGAALDVYRDFPTQADMDGRYGDELIRRTESIRSMADRVFAQEVNVAEKKFQDGQRDEAFAILAGLTQWDLSDLADWAAIRLEELKAMPPDVVVRKDPVEKHPPLPQQHVRGENEVSESTFFGVTLSRANVIYVIDLSGSMQSPWGDGLNRRQAALDELMESINSLRKDQKFLVVFFASQPLAGERFTTADTRGKKRMLEFLGDIRSGRKTVNVGRSTNILTALMDSLRAANRRPDRSVDVVLLSDGQGATPPDVLRVKVKDENRKHAAIHAVGFAFNDPTGLLAGLATDSGGSFVLCDGPGWKAKGAKNRFTAPSNLSMDRRVLNRMKDTCQIREGVDAVEAFRDLRTFLATDGISVPVVREGRQWLEGLVRSQTADARPLLRDADAARTEKRWVPAVEKYRLLVLNCPATPEADAAARHLESLLQHYQVKEALARADKEREAGTLFQLAENYVRNDMDDKAEEILIRILDAYPGTSFSARSSELLDSLRN
jgi:hypothetical protein